MWTCSPGNTCNLRFTHTTYFNTGREDKPKDTPDTIYFANGDRCVILQSNMSLVYTHLFKRETIHECVLCVVHENIHERKADMLTLNTHQVYV